ncbi:MAG: response regulator transcription factor [Ilumatobacteraceae bacterium]|jgi:DNA-binding response OmpR family regulator
MAARVLVVDDAPEFGQLVRAVLTSSGHAVVQALDLATARAELEETRVDLVVLDLGLPDGDGLDLCRWVRENGDTYVLVISGRDQTDDGVDALEAGADDFLAKPFTPRELSARVEALLRRPRRQTSLGGTRVFGDTVIDPVARTVAVAGKNIELTRIEFGLLEALSAEPRGVLSRAELLEKVWGPNWFGDDHVVDVHMANLRRKIERIGQPSILRTVRGVGYGMAL